MPIKDQTNSNARSGQSNRLSIAEDIDWDRAWIRELSFGTALAVPIIYDEYYLTPVTRDSIISLSEASYALFYEDIDGNTVAEVVTILPDVGILNNSGFSGRVTVHDWEGNLKIGYLYENNEIIPFRDETMYLTVGFLVLNIKNIIGVVQVLQVILISIVK